MTEVKKKLQTVNFLINKKTKKYYTVGIFPKSNR